MSLSRSARSLVDGAFKRLEGHRGGNVLFDAAATAVAGRTRTIRHDGLELTFAIPNGLNRFRVDTFSEKEPETLEWIDGIPEGSVLWDVGANIGLYSCYAALRRSCRVVAFEPSVFNLETLVRNVGLNGVAERVTVVPVALTDDAGVGTLHLTSTERGGALSAFGVDFGHDGRPIDAVFRYSTLGVSAVAAVEMGVPVPDFLKLDVDGVEHLILRGARPLLPGVRGILVEVNEAFRDQDEGVSDLLRAAGLEFVQKRRWDRAVDGPFDRTYNQIWRR